MGRKRNRERGGGQDETDWSSERTLADVEAEAAEAAAIEAAAGSFDASPLDATPVESSGFDASPIDASPSGVRSLEAASGASVGAAARCACGSEEFLLEAYLAVVRGRPQAEPVELESMTCPRCGREYEAIWLSDGSIARGGFRGQTDLDD